MRRFWRCRAAADAYWAGGADLPGRESKRATSPPPPQTPHSPHPWGATKRFSPSASRKQRGSRRSAPILTHSSVTTRAIILLAICTAGPVDVVIFIPVDLLTEVAHRLLGKIGV